MSALIQDYIHKGVFEQAPVSGEAIDVYMASAKSALAFAKLGLDAHYEQALAVIYNAALASAQAYLLARGIRTTSKQGHHQAALEVVADELFAGHKVFSQQLFTLRRSRSDVVYGSQVTQDVTRGSVKASYDFIEKVVQLVAAKLDVRIVPYQ